MSNLSQPWPYREQPKSLFRVPTQSPDGILPALEISYMEQLCTSEVTIRSQKSRYAMSPRSPMAKCTVEAIANLCKEMETEPIYLGARKRPAMNLFHVVFNDVLLKPALESSQFAPSCTCDGDLGAPIKRAGEIIRRARHVEHGI